VYIIIDIVYTYVYMEFICIHAMRLL